jgi:flagellar biosynthetic protein FlhB
MSGNKTEQPTAKRKRESRREGRVAKSQELVSWASIYVASLLIGVTYRSATRVTEGLMTELPKVASDPEPAAALAMLGRGASGAMLALAPLLLGLTAVGIAGNVAQIGLRFNGRLLNPKTERINPAAGLKKLFGPQSLQELLKNIVKLVVLGVLAYRSIAGFVPLIASGASFPAVLPAVGAEVMHLVRAVALGGLLIGAADYALSRRRLNKGLRMTKQEVKEEHRQSEGDPHVKQSMRQRQMRMSRMRMMADVAKADVVIVNPVHVAVALRYDPTKGAPRVVAKGTGDVASRIRDAASKAKVPLVEDVPLARTLHKVCEIGDEIPADLYEAVARIIAFVFQLRMRPAATRTTAILRLPA